MERFRMTLAEFYNLPESNTLTEFINGEVIVSSAPKDPHQRSVTRLIVTLDRITPGGELRTAPTDLHIDEVTVLQPDIFWVSMDNQQCVLSEDGYWHGAPDLVVEVLSPATALRDRDEKYALYEKNGVREYWLVDTRAGFIEVYVLRDGKFACYGVFGTDKQFTSPVLGSHVIEVGKILS